MRFKVTPDMNSSKLSQFVKEIEAWESRNATVVQSILLKLIPKSMHCGIEAEAERHVFELVSFLMDSSSILDNRVNVVVRPSRSFPSIELLSDQKLSPIVDSTAQIFAIHIESEILSE
jgi:hypothetical protein